jgi:hypothetical protein
MSCLRCVRRAKADAPCGAYSRGDVLTTKKDLTRRANHWHLFIIARSLRARAGKPVAGFFNRKDERLAKSPVLGNTCPSAAARARLCSWFRSCKKNPETSCAGDGHVYNAGKIHWRPEVCRADGPRLPERRLLVTLLAGCAMLRWKAGGADARV